ncbi:MAG: PEP-CTERM sorting domain-containing protein [Armatimonadota bacterium]
MRRVSWLVTAILLTVSPSYADLLGDRFGVELEVTWSPDDATYLFSHDWTPTGSPTANWSVHDYRGEWSATSIEQNDEITGGEPYDVEAAYMDDDLENLYVSIVTSFPSPEPDGGYFDERLRDGVLVHAGDLALDFGINGAISASDPFSYDWGVNINNEERTGPGSADIGDPPTLGGDVYKTANSHWYVSNEADAATTSRSEMTNFDPDFSSSESRGTAEVYYYLVDFGLDPLGDPKLENGAETWVLEATIPFSALPPTLGPGDRVSAQWVMGCRNDAGAENNVLRVDHTVTPEPGTLALCALGIAALVGVRRRDTTS